MKVLIFMTQFYQLSGAEGLAVELAEQLNSKGIRADILSMYTEDIPGVSEKLSALKKRGINTVHFLGMRVNPSFYSFCTAVIRLNRLIRKQQYDIIETSMVMPAIITSWALFGQRVKHIAGLHRVFRADRENKFLHKFFRFSLWFNRRVRYYAVSDLAVNHWKSYSRFSAHRTRRIYNAIPDEFFQVSSDRHHVYDELCIEKDAKIAIYVGRLAAFKGIDTIFEALAPICEKENIFILYAGLPDSNSAGTTELLCELKNKILHKNLEKRFRFLGYRKDIFRLMSSASVLVHPTLAEGFGLVLVEAMAVGLPVVSSNVEAIPEILSGTDSIMVPPNDPLALQKAVLETLNRPSDQAACAIAKGRKRAQDFRISKRTHEMIQLFDDVTTNSF